MDLVIFVPNCGLGRFQQKIKYSKYKVIAHFSEISQTTFCFYLSACQHHLFNWKEVRTRVQAEFSVKYPETQILLKVPTTNLKSFVILGDCFLWYYEVTRALESLVSFISGPARKIEQSYHYLERLTLALHGCLFLWSFCN